LGFDFGRKVKRKRPVTERISDGEKIEVHLSGYS
jgi:hypothetical protein